jgi:hypothetical protein
VTDAELDDIDAAADPESSAPVRRLVAEARRLRAALQSIADKPSLDPLANAMRAAEALVPEQESRA